jgi:hypothetical protein
MGTMGFGDFPEHVDGVGTPRQKGYVSWQGQLFKNNCMFTLFLITAIEVPLKPGANSPRTWTVDTPVVNLNLKR